jgi:beta-phosphoglucomutase-like phosphatase (HAD superfamily)
MSGLFGLIVDLDGTLCDSAHRDHHAANKEWEQFHSLSSLDVPKRLTAEIVKVLAEKEWLIVACTGRNKKWEPATIAWLTTHGIPIDFILMRPDDNYEPDHELKIRMAKEFMAMLHSQSREWLVLDDREKVVEAWRNAGFTCWQVSPGGY